jgi:hypothetical protein
MEHVYEGSPKAARGNAIGVVFAGIGSDCGGIRDAM